MFNRKKALVAALAAAVPLAIVAPAQASADTAVPPSSQGVLACGLGADPPKKGANNTVVGVGSRTDCGSSRVTLTVRIRKVRPGPIPDKTVGERVHQLFGNGIMTVIGGCDGDGKYFTETKSSGGNEVSSASVQLC